MGTDRERPPGWIRDASPENPIPANINVVADTPVGDRAVGALDFSQLTQKQIDVLDAIIEEGSIIRASKELDIPISTIESRIWWAKIKARHYGTTLQFCVEYALWKDKNLTS